MESIETGTDGAVAVPLESLLSVTHGAVVAVVGISLQRALLFVTNLLLTNGLGVNVYGVFAFGKRLILMIRRFTNLGSEVAVIRFLPKYADDPARQNRVLGLAYATTLVANLIGAIALFVGAPQLNALTLEEPVFTDVIRFYAVLLPFESFLYLFSNYFRSLELVEYQIGTIRVARPAAWLLGAGIGLLLEVSVTGVVIAITAAVAVVTVGSLGLSLQKTSPRPRMSRSRSEAVEFYNYSLPVSVARLGQVLRGRIDILLIGVFLTASGAGIYDIALFLTGFIRFPLMSFNQLFPSIASKLYSEDRYRQLNALYSTITRWIFALALLIAGYELVYRIELLGLFGQAFTEGVLVYVVFVISRLIGSSVGATGWLLRMTDHQYLAAANSWILGLINVSVSYYFILKYGLIGAAIGTAGSYAIVNLIRVAQLTYLESLFPFTWKFLKPLTAGIVATGAMVVVSWYLSGVAVLLGGAIVGIGVYAGVLVALGIEPEDKEFSTQLLAAYTESST